MLRLCCLLLLLGRCLMASIGSDPQADSFPYPFQSSEGVIEGVNVVTGTYTEYNVELTTKGIDPCALERCYFRDSKRPALYADLDSPNLLGWYANYDTTLWYESDGVNIDDHIAISQKTGGFLHYKRPRGSSRHHASDLPGYVNHTLGELSGQTNLHNAYVEWAGRRTFNVCSGDGRLKCFTRKHAYHRPDLPCGAKLAWERKPSGNMLITKPEGCYTRSADEQVCLNWLNFSREHKGAWTIENSDHRKVVCYPGKQLDRVRGSSVQLLQKIVLPDGNAIHYHYNNQKKREDDFFLGKDLPEGRYLRVEYEATRHRTGKVTALIAPLGNDQTPTAKYRFQYAPYHTDVHDAIGNGVRYEFDGNKRITKVIHHQHGSPYRSERNIWSDKGSLLAKLLTDASGNIQLARRFFYDERENVVCEKVFGILTGTSFIPIQTDHQGLPFENGAECYTKTYAYSQDGFNLLLSESDGIAKTTYAYVTGTNLLQSKLIEESGKIRLRSFRSYDGMRALTEWIEDDGSSSDCNHLADCTLRKIIRYENRREAPGIGQPGVKEERHYDFGLGKEVLEKRTLYTYDSHNDCIREEIFDGENQVLYAICRAFDAMGRCIYETDPCGNAITRVFDANGNLIQESGPLAGTLVENGYDYSNRLLWTRKSDSKGESHTLRFRYDFCGNKIAQMDVNGSETLFTYDCLGREIKVCYPPTPDANDSLLSTTVCKSYDICDNVTEWIDENGISKKAWYTIRGAPYRIVTGGVEERFEYDLRGNLIKKIAPDRSYSLFTYDFLDRATSARKFSPHGEVLEENRVTYSAFVPLCTQDSAGDETLIFYDYAGREAKVVKGSECVEKTYDSLGFLASQKQWHSAQGYLQTRFVNDFLGRKVEETLEDEKGNNYCKKQWVYDPQGLCTELVIFFSATVKATTFFTYDAFGREIEKRTPEGHLTVTQYQEVCGDGCGGHGSLCIQKDPSGNVTESLFDARGRLIQEVSKNGALDTLCRKKFRYDGVGNRTLFKQEKRPGEWQSVRFTYGDGGKLSSLIEDEARRTTYYFYDVSGHLIGKETPLTLHEFEYDFLGQVVSHTALSGDEKTQLRYHYDFCGRPTQIWHNGKETMRRYDPNGNMVYEKQESGCEVSYVYDRAGRRTQMMLPGGVSIDYMYEGPHLQKLEKSLIGQVQYTHQYSKRDWCGQVQEALLTNGGKVFTTHDLEGRVRSVESLKWKQTASYSPTGNLSHLISHDSKGPSICGFAYDGLNQLQHEEGKDYTYDGVGNRGDCEVGPCNILVRSGASSFSSDALGRMIGIEGSTCDYDPLDRLVRYDTTTYTYDGLNRRMSRAGCCYVYDGNREIGSLNTAGEWEEFRLLGEGRGAELGSTVAIEIQGVCYAAVCDVRGSIGALFDQAGKLVENYRYAAFGTQLNASEIGNPWGFSGKRVDSESGWVFFGRRHYAPALGRFTTPDPLGYVSDLNLYLFVHNNPLTHADLYGYHDEVTQERRRGPLGSTNIVDFLGKLFHRGMSTLEWIGKNLIPIPGVRDCVEAIGRWGAGGKLFATAEYHKSRCQAYVVEGEKLANLTNLWTNGVCNSLEEAITVGKAISREFEGLQIIILYNSSNGLLLDLLECCLLKLGGMSIPEKIIIESVQGILEKSPNEVIMSLSHSQGGLHMYNAARCLTQAERSHIEAITFGSAKLIPEDMFRSITNFVSWNDMVPMSDTVNYFKARMGNSGHVTFLPATYQNPFREHMMLETTYFSQLAKIGQDLRRRFS